MAAFCLLSVSFLLLKVISTMVCHPSIQKNWKSLTPCRRSQVCARVDFFQTFTALLFLMSHHGFCSASETASLFSDVLCIQSWPENMSDLSVFSNLQTIQGRTLYKWAIVVFSLCSNTAFVSLVDSCHIAIMLLYLCDADNPLTDMNLFFCVSYLVSPFYMSFLHRVEEWALEGTVNNSHACHSLPCHVRCFTLKYLFLVSVFYIILWFGGGHSSLMSSHGFLASSERYLSGKCWNLRVWLYFMEANKAVGNYRPCCTIC